MLSRPVLRRLELYLARGALDTWKTRSFGNATAAEFQIRELLHRSRYLYGIHEYVPASVFVANIPAGSVVLDVGANLGEYTVLAARATGNKGLVIAYEPNPVVRQRLVRNVNANGFDNVEVFPNALGSKDGTAVLRVPQDDSVLGTLRPEAVGTEFRVALRRLDAMLDKRDRSRLSMIKLDVEGFELEVLKGAKQTIAEMRPVIVYECGEELFEARHGRILTPAMAFLEDAGYDNFVIRMSKRARWALEPAGDVDPRKYREPWGVLMVVGIHRDRVRDSHLSGVSSLRPCGIFELIGR